MAKKRFEKALPYSVSFIIPGYEKSYPPGIFKTLALSRRDSAEWYWDFVALMEASIGKKYLPICRLSDGEFIFCLGTTLPPIRRDSESLSKYIFRIAKTYLVRVLRPELRHQFRGGKDTTIASGVYTPKEWKELRHLYARQLRLLSEDGILGLHFSYRNNQFAQQYFVPMVKWLKTNNIELTEKNYYPFYFTYALLNGPQRPRILGRNKILIVSHCDEKKSHLIEKYLKNEGSKDVQFLQISKNRSMYDNLDFSRVRLPVDVVLVGAGIGKPNILLQLKETNTLCIDAGFVIECIAYPEFRRSREGARTFCWADFERNGDYTPI